MDFFSDNQNDSFSSMIKCDLKMLKEQLNILYLSYRDTLKVSLDTTFGVEIEFEQVDYLKVDNFIKEYFNNWMLKKEAAILVGGEVVSPILFDEKSNWLELKKICEFLKNSNANPHEKASGHIHVGNMLGDDVTSWRVFLKLYTIFEHVLFYFGYGERLCGRKKINVFSKPMANVLNSKMWRINIAKSTGELLAIYPSETRYQSLNLIHVDNGSSSDKLGNTIEFRFFNGTIEEIIWQNNVNVLTKMLIAVKNGKIDEDYLDYLLKKQEEAMLLNERLNDQKYSNLCFEDALIFADIIFDNNLDKAYFLRQYSKSFDNCADGRSMTLARNFIK